MILILSEDSIGKDWAENEYNHAIAKEMISGKTTLVPVSLDNAVQSAWQPWAIKMRRSRYTADFSKWQDNEFYQEMLSYLLEELSVEEESLDYGDVYRQNIANAENDFSEANREVHVRDLPPAFRPEYQKYC